MVLPCEGRWHAPVGWFSGSSVVLSEAVAVTESDLDPKVRKMAETFPWLCDMWAEHAGMYLKCYWF